MRRGKENPKLNLSLNEYSSEEEVKEINSVSSNTRIMNKILNEPSEKSSLLGRKKGRTDEDSRSRQSNQLANFMTTVTKKAKLKEKVSVEEEQEIRLEGKGVTPDNKIITYLEDEMMSLWDAMEELATRSVIENKELKQEVQELRLLIELGSIRIQGTQIEEGTKMEEEPQSIPDSVMIKDKTMTMTTPKPLDTPVVSYTTKTEKKGKDKNEKKLEQEKNKWKRLDDNKILESRYENLEIIINQKKNKRKKNKKKNYYKEKEQIPEQKDKNLSESFINNNKYINNNINKINYLKEINKYPINKMEVEYDAKLASLMKSSDAFPENLKDKVRISDKVKLTFRTTSAIGPFLAQHTRRELDGEDVVCARCFCKGHLQFSCNRIQRCYKCFEKKIRENWDAAIVMNKPGWKLGASKDVILNLMTSEEKCYFIINYYNVLEKTREQTRDIKAVDCDKHGCSKCDGSHHISKCPQKKSEIQKSIGNNKLNTQKRNRSVEQANRSRIMNANPGRGVYNPRGNSRGVYRGMRKFTYYV